jgi:cardiolipin synthase
VRLGPLLIGASLAAAAASCAGPPLPGPPGARAGPDPRVNAELVSEGKPGRIAHHFAGAAASPLEAPLVPGNDARLLVDGPATHRAMFDAIARARDHINLESYIVEADEVGERLADLLMRKQKQGVRINVLYDGVGSLDTPKEYFERLRAAGIAVCEFNPVNPAKAPRGWQINNRDHRKVLVVDGRVAFTGGINISGVYSAGSFGSGRRAPSREEGWRDTHILTRGPVVAQFQRLFLEAWARQQCGEPAQASYFPRLAAQGNWTMRVVASDPARGESEMYVALLSAIGAARERVWLTYGYFVPDPDTVRTLKEAAARGVDVRLVLPGFSDFWAPLYAGRSHYDELLAAGARIFERRDALLHAKTAVIDGVWSSVGSTNLDWRSFVHNYEADVIVLGETFAGDMERLFIRDLEHSHEVALAAWRRRGLVPRVREWAARAWEYYL